MPNKLREVSKILWSTVCANQASSGVYYNENGWSTALRYMGNP